jgi:hypothetical protein
MRMVWSAAPEDDYLAARDRLVRRFQAWARRRGIPVDAFAVEALLDHRWEDGDGLLGRWRPEDFVEALCDWFPRQVTLPAEQRAAVVPTARAFVSFLFEEDLADARCTEQDELQAALVALTDDFTTAMADESRYGPAKFWVSRMMDAGIDPTDAAAAQRYIDEVRAGRVPVDQRLLDQVMTNQFADDAGPPVLPLVAVPDNDHLRQMAEDSVVLRRLQQFVEWTGSGRALTQTGRLKLADAREVIGLLDLADEVDPVIGTRVFRTVSSDELYELSVLVAWARAARLVRVVKGRLLPVKAASPVLADPVALGHRAFSAFFQVGGAVCGSGYAESIIRWRFDEAVLAVVMALYAAPSPTSRGDVRDLTLSLVEGSLMLAPADGEQATVWRDMADADVDRIVEQLELLGAVRVAGRELELTPFGMGLVSHYLGERGVPVRVIEDLLDETVEVVVAAAAETKAATGDALLRAWCDRHPTTAGSDLSALAERTDDSGHRKLAKDHAKLAKDHARRR